MHAILSIIMEWIFFLLSVSIYLFVRCTALIIRVFVFYRCRTLWISFAVFLATIVLAGVLLLASMTLAPAAQGAVYMGFIQLAITAKFIEIKSSDVFMKEQDTLIGSVLHTNWFQLH